MGLVDFFPTQQKNILVDRWQSVIIRNYPYMDVKNHCVDVNSRKPFDYVQITFKLRSNYVQITFDCVQLAHLLRKNYVIF